MAAVQPLFDETFLRRLEALSLVTHQRAHGHLRGQHRSVRRGVGMVFSDFRPYSPGDDTRHIDWGIYMRLDRLLLRLFEEEADLPIYIFVDASKSMGFGAPAKFDYARKLAAALGRISLLNHDRVSLVAYNDGIVDTLPAGRGKNQAYRVFKFLEGLQASGKTQLNSAVRNYFGSSRPRGFVVLISDFLDPEGVEEPFAILRRYRHDVAVLQVTEPSEESPELPEEVMLVDSESEVATEVHVTPALLEAYRKAFKDHCDAIASWCRKYGWSYAQASTAVNFDDLMLKFFREHGVLR
ncbi:MAG: DUF58 domain-containing protein [Betaproteobacteria bacterium]|nr:DUF58 domain-containing protein [Betaproteobacteria bacterium]